MKYMIINLSFLFITDGCLVVQKPNASIEYHKKYKYIGEPLFLTPLLERGRIGEAQELSKVYLPYKDIRSYSGYITVNKSCESNIYFWFFLAEKNWEKAPIVLWLQGGPGASSMYGLFREVGPFSYDKSRSRTGWMRRTHPWNIKNNLLIIDQPVGTGFSFSRKGCYAKTETEVSRDLYSALTQFYQLFPSLQENKFYIAGESYAGHYIPSIAHTIHRNNPTANIRINLSGMMIGNGLMDVLYQSDYASYLYQHGLIDDLQADHLYSLQSKMIETVQKKNWMAGSAILLEILNDYLLFMGNVSNYNYLKKYQNTSTIVEPWEYAFQDPKMRKSLHVGNQEFVLASGLVLDYLEADIVQSVKPQVEELLEHYSLVFFNGELDIICAYPMAVNFFKSLQWSGANDYLKALRQHWCMNGELAGYFKSAHNLHEVMVRAAGHEVTRDQPLWAFELMDSVTSSPATEPLQKLSVCHSKNLSFLINY